MREIFVFGSNLAGRHGKGAALFAKKNHGAIQGQGRGLQGNSYGIPTKDGDLKTLPLSEIRFFIHTFLLFAAANRDMIFNVTPIGCGLAGYRHSDIAPMFAERTENVILPEEFKKVLYGT